MTKKTLNLIILAVFVFNIALTGLVLAQESSTGDSVLPGFAETGKQAGFKLASDKIAPANDFTQAFPAYATGMASILGAFFLIIIIYAGWLWMTAQGNEEKVTKAKARILAGFVGLMLVIVARIIAEIAINVLSKTVVTQ